MTRERRLRVRDVDFDELPAAVRERFRACLAGGAEPRPLARDVAPPSSAGDVALVLAGAAIAAITAIRGFGETTQGVAARGLYALGALLVATGLLAVAHRRAAARALPFAAGRYLFPLVFVGARAKVIEIVRLGNDARVEVAGTDDTASLDVLIGARRESFAMTRRAADEANRAVKQALRALDAADGGDAARSSGDPLAPADAADASAESAPKTAPLPRWLTPGPRAVIAVSFAAIASTALFGVRERANDDALFSRAKREGSVAALEAYAASGGRHAAEVRDELLPAAHVADEVAKKRAAAVHADQALAAFRARASTADPRLVPVMERLVGALERRGDPRVALEFRPPTRAVLDAVDGILAERAGAGFPVVKVAPYFDAARTKKHEPAAARAIAAAFADAFPPEVLRVEPGEPSDGAPSIEVGYIVGWAGDAVIDEAGKRRFVSVVVDFDVTLDVPGEAAFKIHLRVPPPDDLEVKVDADADTASEAAVYEAMATHAFNAVGAEVRKALLKP